MRCVRVEDPVEKKTKWHANRRYLPLDELLAMPRVRVLRTLLHFDWARGEDINDALDLVDKLAVNTHSAVLSRLVRDGYIERRGTTCANFRYQINASGRAHLKALLARGEVNEGGEVIE